MALTRAPVSIVPARKSCHGGRASEVTVDTLLLAEIVSVVELSGATFVLGIVPAVGSGIIITIRSDTTEVPPRAGLDQLQWLLLCRARTLRLSCGRPALGECGSGLGRVCARARRAL